MKRQQNILAENSNGEIWYICGKCGKVVDKEAVICPHCQSRLGDIRCPFCNFTGTLEDFKEDTCPQCGRTQHLSKERNTTSSHNTAAKRSENHFFNSTTFWVLFIGLSGLLAFFIFLIIKSL